MKNNDASKIKIISVNYPKYDKEKLVVNERDKNNYLIRYSLKSRKSHLDELVKDESFVFDFERYQVDLVKFYCKESDLESFKHLFRFVNERNFSRFVYVVAKCICKSESNNNLDLLTLVLENFKYDLDLDYQILDMFTTDVKVGKEVKYDFVKVHNVEIIRNILEYQNIKLRDDLIFSVVLRADPELLKVFLESSKIDPSYLDGKDSVFTYCERIENEDKKEIIHQMLRYHPLLLEKPWIEEGEF